MRVKKRNIQASERTAPIADDYGVNASTQKLPRNNNNVNTKLSLDIDDEIAELAKSYGAIPSGENPAKDVTVPRKTSPFPKLPVTGLRFQRFADELIRLLTNLSYNPALPLFAADEKLLFAIDIVQTVVYIYYDRHTTTVVVR